MVDLPEIAPLLPLPDHVLLPFLPTPYRLFQPSHLSLARALLDKERRKRWVAVPRLEGEADAEGGGDDAPFSSLAVAARVHQLLPLASDHYLMLAEGRARVRLTEAESDLGFRLAWLQALPDEVDVLGDPDPDTVVRLARLLADHEGGSVLSIDSLLSDSPDAGVLAWRVAGAYLRDADQRQQILGLPNARARLQRIEEILEQTLQRSARRNGGPPVAED